MADVRRKREGLIHSGVQRIEDTTFQAFCLFGCQQVAIVFFSSVTAIIRGLISEEALDCAAAVLLEVCSAVDFLSDGMTIEAVAFAVGFGGLCVHFQIFSALESVRISKLLFFVIRIIQGAITALLTHLGLIAFPQARPVFSSVQTALPASFGRNAVSGLALIMTAVFFLFSIKSLKRR